LKPKKRKKKHKKTSKNINKTQNKCKNSQTLKQNTRTKKLKTQKHESLTEWKKKAMNPSIEPFIVGGGTRCTRHPLGIAKIF
jgi:hypothetical protein